MKEKLGAPLLLHLIKNMYLKQYESLDIQDDIEK